MKEQEVKKEGKERSKVRREKLASYFFDLSKLSYAGLVLGTMIPLFQQEFKWGTLIQVIWGILFTSILALIGNKMLK
jgi:hypothetical protein